jgi:hypothetical protein
MEVDRALDRLRQLVHGSNDPEPPRDPQYTQRFQFYELGGLFHVEFYGEPWWEDGEVYSQVMAGISSDPIAPAIASLRLGGPDEGANGTKNWDLTALATTNATFANLQYLLIEQNRPGNHNCSIVAKDKAYDEEGVLAEIVRRAPKLGRLMSPSAPSREFFDVDLPSLGHLNVDAGYDSQDFILNLSQSASLPRLRQLDWGECNVSSMNDERSTPFAHYQALFRSKAFRQVTSFVLRNPSCSTAELAELKAMRPDLQMLVVKCTQKYV